MEIINRVPSDKVAKDVICENCGVTLRYVPADTRIETRRDYTGGTDSYRVITCLNCGHVFDVSFY